MTFGGVSHDHQETAEVADRGSSHAVDAQGSVPASAQDEKPVEVGGGEVQVDGGVEQVDSAVATSGAPSEADLAQADVSVAAVGIDATGGLAGDDSGEKRGVEKVVASLGSDDAGDACPAPAAEPEQLPVQLVSPGWSDAVGAAKRYPKNKKHDT